jgi:hypothetical protein
MVLCAQIVLKSTSCLQAVFTDMLCWGSHVMQGGRPGLDDVSSLDAVLHSNLLAVKSCPPEQVEHLCLTFAAEQQVLGKVSNRRVADPAAGNRLAALFGIAAAEQAQK